MGAPVRGVHGQGGCRQAQGVPNRRARRIQVRTDGNQDVGARLRESGDEAPQQVQGQGRRGAGPTRRLRPAQARGVRWTVLDQGPVRGESPRGSPGHRGEVRDSARSAADELRGEADGRRRA